VFKFQQKYPYEYYVYRVTLGGGKVVMNILRFLFSCPLEYIIP